MATAIPICCGRTTTAPPAIWETNGSSVIGGGSLANPGPSWHVIGVGDFNDDGRSDILWQNDSGEAAIWEMNGTTVIGAGSLGNPRAELARQGHRRLQRRRLLRCVCGRTTTARLRSGK